MTYDSASDSCRIEEVVRKLERNHRGRMVSLKTRSVDCLVTPDHRVVLRREQRAKGRRRKYDWTFCAASEVPHQIELPAARAVERAGRGIKGLTEETMRILGWVLTDGSVQDRKNEDDTLRLTQSTRTVKRGLKLASEMSSVLSARGVGEPYKRNRVLNGRKFVVHEWFLGKSFSSELYRWLLRPMLLKNERRIPRKLIEDSSLSQLRALYEGLMEGDGTSLDGKTWRAFTPGLCEGFADDLQEIATLLGTSTTKGSTMRDGKRSWTVHVRQRTTHHVRRPRNETYDGKVWDVTVPSGAFVVRRNGRVFITGNCPQSVEAGNKAQRRALGVGDRIVRRARVKGIGVTLITQRPAVISKNVLSQVDGIFFLSVTAPHDLEAIESWMRPAVADQDRRLALEALPMLDRGEAFFVQAHKKSGAIMKFRTRVSLTFDSSRTPSVDDPEPPVPSLSKVSEDVWRRVGGLLGKGQQISMADLAAEERNSGREDIVGDDALSNKSYGSPKVDDDGREED